MPRAQIPNLMWGGHLARHRKRPYLATNFTLAGLAAESEPPARESAKRSFPSYKTSNEYCPGLGKRSPAMLKMKFWLQKKRLSRGFSHGELNPWTPFRENRLSIRIDKRNLNGVLPFVPRAKKKPERNRAVRMHRGVLPRTDGVKGSQNTKLTLIITGRICNQSGKNFHPLNSIPFFTTLVGAGWPYQSHPSKIPPPFIPIFILNFPYAPLFSSSSWLEVLESASGLSVVRPNPNTYSNLSPQKLFSRKLSSDSNPWQPDLPIS